MVWPFHKSVTSESKDRVHDSFEEFFKLAKELIAVYQVKKKFIDTLASVVDHVEHNKSSSPEENAKLFDDEIKKHHELFIDVKEAIGREKRAKKDFRIEDHMLLNSFSKINRLEDSLRGPVLSAAHTAKEILLTFNEFLTEAELRTELENSFIKNQAHATYVDLVKKWRKEINVLNKIAAEGDKFNAEMKSIPKKGFIFVIGSTLISSFVFKTFSWSNTVENMRGQGNDWLPLIFASLLIIFDIVLLLKHLQESFSVSYAKDRKELMEMAQLEHIN